MRAKTLFTAVMAVFLVTSGIAVAVGGDPNDLEDQKLSQDRAKHRPT